MNRAPSHRRLLIGLAPIVLLSQLFVLGCTDITATRPRTFGTPAEAASTLAAAARDNDPNALIAILGDAAEKLIVSGDPVQDQASRHAFATAYDAKQSLIPAGPDRIVLQVGDDEWPLPIPIVLSNGRWHFDSDEGVEELINRRVGKNELLAIQTLLTGVAAQQDYFDRQKRTTGHGTYAREIISSPGLHDGLYWEAEPGTRPSPLASLIDPARDDEGYPGPEAAGGRRTAYRGYFFRILEAQGASAPGRARTYVRSGRMTGGFAFLAWPAEYGSSGIMTFMIGPDGVPYQQDLGTNTEQAAAAITRFDPNEAWTRVTIE